MRSIIRPNERPGSAFSVALIAAWAIGCGGCQHMVNPFVDDLPVTSELTTASVAGARIAAVQPTLPRREFAAVPVGPQDGTVDHWPLWWEDPFEDKGSDDDQFAWTAEDYLAMCYSPGRFLVANTFFFPLSACVTKPLTIMCSDGRLSRQALGYDHDAIPCPGGTAPPIDILEVGTYHEESSPTAASSSADRDPSAAP